MRQRAALGAAFLAVWLASEGDVQLASALRSLGPLDLSQPGRALLACLTHAPLWGAVALLSGHFFLWLYVLARLELSVAVPITACNYVFNAILVQVRLGETVSPKTWAGTLFITLGVLLVTRSLGHRRAPE